MSNVHTTFQKYLDWKAKTWRDLGLEVTQFKAVRDPMMYHMVVSVLTCAIMPFFLWKWDDSLENYTLSTWKKIYTPFSTRSIPRKIQIRKPIKDSEFSKKRHNLKLFSEWFSWHFLHRFRFGTFVKLFDKNVNR